MLSPLRIGTTGLTRSAQEKLQWSSGHDARFTRERSPVQSWAEVVFVFVGRHVSVRHGAGQRSRDLVSTRVERFFVAWVDGSTVEL